MRFPYTREQQMVWYERQIPRLEAERDARRKKGDNTWTGVEADLKHCIIMVAWLRHQLGLPLAHSHEHITS